ncbi:MAG TPA: penicillin acylase family protein [Candidatus Baltobacteraceae bacterium]|nr:penicillin acylase family protein [Candidatus Baltobacteraceae bacterium]
MSTSERRRARGTVARVLGALLAIVLILAVVWGCNAAIGMRAAAQRSGTIAVRGLRAPVQILRDSRGIPHIRAGDDRDLFFAQGFAEASDRLFQMDLLRRFVYGRLGEVIGRVALSADVNARTSDVAGIVNAQWAQLSTRDRVLVQAFSDGVNAAMQSQPLPVEFRLLLYKPDPWRPQDSLAVGMATALDLIDPWDDVIRRDQVAAQNGTAAADLYSITDPAYDAPVSGDRPAPVAPLRSLNRGAAFSLPEREAIGSNEWAAGADHSRTGAALLANDPHLRLQIPGVWYLIEMSAPGFHVAGGSLAGTPGVILGHNDRIAWGATNGTVVTEVVYRDSLRGARARTETFHVRFGPDVRMTYYTTRHGFVVKTSGDTAYAVDWNAYRSPKTALTTFEGLDRAQSIAQALQALRAYPGPPQNFVLADTRGNAAYHLAGLVPNDPSWGMRVHAAGDAFYPFIPFDRLPHVDPARSALVFTANNRMYGAGYPYRLTAFFDPPYRAARIRQLLRAQPRLSVADFTRLQADTLSLPERELAREILSAAQRKGVRNDPALVRYLDAAAAWNGRFDPQSGGAAIVRETAARAAALLAKTAAGPQSPYQGAARPTISAGLQLVLLMRVMRERPRGWCPRDDCDAVLIDALREAVAAKGTTLLQSWGEYDPIAIKHPFSPLGLRFLNGITLPGDGDSYTIHVQNARDTQSFRAVWTTGDWDAGGISIPSGESGEPGSGHYTDQSAAWLRGELAPLPFSDAAVRAAAVDRLLLTPR